MILRGIVGFFKVIIEAISKIVAWLLIALGLWLPAIFCALFFITCAATGTDFRSISSLFFGGLIVTTILSLWFTLSGGKNKKRKEKASKPSPTYLPKIQEKSDRVELTTTPSNGSVFRGKKDDEADAVEKAQDNSNLSNYQQLLAKLGIDPNNYQPPAFQQQNYQPQNFAPNQFQSYQTPNYQNQAYQAYQGPSYQNSAYQNSGFQNQNYHAASYQQGYQSGYHEPLGYRDNLGYDNKHDGFIPYPKYNTQNNQDAYYGGQRDYDGRGYDRDGYQDPRSRGKFEDEDDNPYGFAPYKKPQTPVRYGDGYADGYGYNNNFNARPNATERPRKTESPRIFLSRNDNALLIYEFSDRLEFHRKTPSGVVHESTRFKNM